ncbi:surface-associated interspersed protein (SURFIN), partial [Plasmodium relictum]
MNTEKKINRRKTRSASQYGAQYDTWKSKLTSDFDNEIYTIYIEGDNTEKGRKCRNFNNKVDDTKEDFMGEKSTTLNVNGDPEEAWNEIEQHISTKISQYRNLKCMRNPSIYTKDIRDKRNKIMYFCEDRDKRFYLLKMSKKRDECLKYNQWINEEKNKFTSNNPWSISDSKGSNQEFKTSNNCTLINMGMFSNENCDNYSQNQQKKSSSQSLQRSGSPPVTTQKIYSSTAIPIKTTVPTTTINPTTISTTTTTSTPVSVTTNDSTTANIPISISPSIPASASTPKTIPTSTNAPINTATPTPTLQSTPASTATQATTTTSINVPTQNISSLRSTLKPATISSPTSTNTSALSTTKAITPTTIQATTFNHTSTTTPPPTFTTTQANISTNTPTTTPPPTFTTTQANISTNTPTTTPPPTSTTTQTNTSTNTPTTTPTPTPSTVTTPPPTSTTTQANTSTPTPTPSTIQATTSISTKVPLTTSANVSKVNASSSPTTLKPTTTSTSTTASTTTPTTIQATTRISTNVPSATSANVSKANNTSSFSFTLKPTTMSTSTTVPTTTLSTTVHNQSYSNISSGLSIKSSSTLAKSTIIPITAALGSFLGIIILFIFLYRFTPIGSWLGNRRSKRKETQRKKKQAQVDNELIFEGFSDNKSEINMKNFPICNKKNSSTCKIILENENNERNMETKNNIVERRKKWKWKAVIEVHMMVLEEFQKEEWELNRREFLKIC